jgi:hypothetical protein
MRLHKHYYLPLSLFLIKKGPLSHFDDAQLNLIYVESHASTSPVQLLFSGPFTLKL